MKRLAVLLSLVAVLALIVATDNYEINSYQRVKPSLSDGNFPPPPWQIAPPLSADGNFPPPPWHPVLNHLSA